jgi:hypothetical protein
VSRPPARHQKPSPQSSARVALYDGPHDEALYGEAAYDSNPYDGRYDEGPYAETSFDDARYAEPRLAAPYAEPRHAAPYAEAPYGDFRYAEASYGDFRYAGAPYGDGRYAEASYDDVRYAEAPYGDGRYAEAPYGDGRYLDPRYDAGSYGEAPYDEALHNDGRPAQAASDQARYDQAPFAQATYDQGLHHDGHDGGVSDSRRLPPNRRGAHRHARPSRMRRKPVKIAAAMAGSTLLVAGAAPVAAHFWHRPATHPTALDQENPASTPGAALGAGPRIPGQPGAPENTLAQWAQVPIGKHAAAQVSAAKRAARRATVQPSHSPQPKPSPKPSPKATASSAYQNPLRAVSDLELERVDMGVDFGGAGPVYALGDGVITNATGDSSGWPGGGWITYQLTDGPDAGLVVYVAEDVKPTVEVGQKVTSSTVVANMFNGGDGIETGWATSDSSTAESQMAAAGGISGGGPFPTMVGLSFDAVLESVGVPAAPNANEPGNGLLPAGYPPT